MEGVLNMAHFDVFLCGKYSRYRLNCKFTKPRQSALFIKVPNAASRNCKLIHELAAVLFGQ
jgi:hypothetical protein